jgi:peroxisomal membrane protein 4
MTFLFRPGPYHPLSPQSLTLSRLKGKFGGIFKLTFQHARNLGVFVTIYKTLMYLQQSSRGGREERLDSFLAGLVGGCYIFGNDSAVVQQVLLPLARD